MSAQKPGVDVGIWIEKLDSASGGAASAGGPPEMRPECGREWGREWGGE